MADSGRRAVTHCVAALCCALYRAPLGRQRLHILDRLSVSPDKSFDQPHRLSRVHTHTYLRDLQASLVQTALLVPPLDHAVEEEVEDVAVLKILVREHPPRVAQRRHPKSSEEGNGLHDVPRQIKVRQVPVAPRAGHDDGAKPPHAPRDRDLGLAVEVLLEPQRWRKLSPHGLLLHLDPAGLLQQVLPQRRLQAVLGEKVLEHLVRLQVDDVREARLVVEVEHDAYLVEVGGDLAGVGLVHPAVRAEGLELAVGHASAGLVRKRGAEAEYPPPLEQGGELGSPASLLVVLDVTARSRG